MRLNNAGKIAQWEWERLARHFDFVELDAFVVMPNYVHGIIILRDLVGATRMDISNTSPKNNNLHVNINFHENHIGSPLPAKGPSSKSLSAIVGQFKSRVTKHIHTTDEFSPEKIWQRGFHDHTIRNEDEWRKIHL